MWRDPGCVGVGAAGGGGGGGGDVGCALVCLVGGEILSIGWGGNDGF